MTDATRSSTGDAGRRFQTLAIFLVSMAGLLLEVGYSRIVSYKLWYYYTYLVIGLALLGIGSGGIFVVLSKRLRQTATERVIALCSIFSAISIVVGYLIVSRVPVNTVSIWEYGTGTSVKNLAIVALISFTIFASFVPLGIIVSTILGRAPDGVGRLYFADLVGAGVGCMVAIPLISRLGPPDVVATSALIFGVVGLLALPRRIDAYSGIGALATVVLVVVLAGIVDLPDVRPEDTKIDPSVAAFSEWGPVFRVDVIFVGAPGALLAHDGTFGSAMRPYTGDPSSSKSFESDPRALPFRLLGDPPARVAIIGSAAGNEIVASLHFDAERIDAVELNPVTLSLLKNHYKDFTGDLGNQPGVTLHEGDGRTYLARSNHRYDLIWYVAPDSYAVSNAASSNALVLSESYLYTKEAIAESLDRLSDDGVMVAQFGELDFGAQPDRTARYVMTARAAFKQLGIEDPSRHMLVSALITPDDGDLSTIMLKRTPFTEAEIARYAEALPDVPHARTAWQPGTRPTSHIVSELAAATNDTDANQFASTYGRDIDAVTDDSPFMWHFVSFDEIARNITKSLDAKTPEDSIGERVLLLLLAISILYAFLFLLAPFFVVRKEWRALPRKATSAIYFAALGLGFMFFEITMIQRLVLFLGHPTYSLTVTLASILVFTGLGALSSKRFADRRGVMPTLLAVLFVLTVFYQSRLDDLTGSLLDESLGVRVVVALLVLAPLGFCLGMFMPLGLGAVAKLGGPADEYVAWAWAVNGFFSVIGSVLTTILSMSFGFTAVQYLGLAVYGIAVVAYMRLSAQRTPTEPEVDITLVESGNLGPVSAA